MKLKNTLPNFFTICLAFLFMQQLAFAQKAYKRISFLDKINSIEDFNALQSTPLSERYSNVKSIKLIYEIATNKIYFIQSKKYKFHFSFVNEFLNGYEDLDLFNNIEYSSAKGRKYLLSNLNYFPTSNLFVVDFFADDVFEKKLYDDFYKKILSAVYFKNELFILPNQWMKLWKEQDKFISEADIYGKQTYQVLVKGETYGYLKIIGKGNFDYNKISKNDIVITESMPLQLPPVKGIVTNVFQTPLSHVNILCQARGTVNCALIDIFKNEDLKKLDGKLVKMSVSFDTVIISLPFKKFDANKYFKNELKNKSITLPLDTSSKTGLLNVKLLFKKDIPKVGGKAAHLGELANIVINGKPIPLPENGFAIPIYYYFEHVNNNKISKSIDALLENELIKNNPELLKKELEKIKLSIVDAPIDEVLVAAVKRRILLDTSFANYRFRSSTNAEDIEGFSGAGLYDSKTGSAINNKKPIDVAIKKVWASLWNIEAFNERTQANINQHSIGMGILVHRAFGTEEVNGVAVTKNLYRNNFDGITLNMQKGEVSVSNADDSVICEQLIIKMMSNIKEGSDIGMEYISYSPLNIFKPLLSIEEVKELTTYLYEIKKRFYKLYGGSKNVTFENFAVDVEFKLNKDDRKIYIKQARLY
jgi:pyruvate, water dikinase